MALGATSRQLLTLVVGAAARLAAIGLVAGVALALALGRGLQALLFGIGAADPVTVAGVLAMVALVALVSSYLPARRLSRVDPVTALRSE
jgi:putative ABC transport system permease protein